MPNERPSPEDLYWAREALKLERTNLATMQGVAEKWRGGLAALTGIVATVSAVGSPYIAGSVSGTSKTIVGVLLVLALGSLSAATWNAMNAAFGVPEKIGNNGEALREWTRDRIPEVKSGLDWARRFTVAGVSAMAIAAAVGLFTASQDETSYIETVSGQKLCGLARTTDDGSEVKVTGSDGTVTAVKIADLKIMKLSGSCTR